MNGFILGFVLFSFGLVESWRVPRLRCSSEDRMVVKNGDVCLCIRNVLGWLLKGWVRC